MSRVAEIYEFLRPKSCISGEIASRSVFSSGRSVLSKVPCPDLRFLRTSVELLRRSVEWLLPLLPRCLFLELGRLLRRLLLLLRELFVFLCLDLSRSRPFCLRSLALLRHRPSGSKLFLMGESVLSSLLGILILLLFGESPFASTYR